MAGVASIDEAVALAAAPAATTGVEATPGTLMVIGGGEVYAQALPLATRLHLTWVDTRVDGADAWFPRFDAAGWTMVDSERHDIDARHAHAFRFADYVRR
jgi:dihydrofolate reductase